MLASQNNWWMETRLQFDPSCGDRTEIWRAEMKKKSDPSEGRRHGKHPSKALSVSHVRNAKPGKYADGNGLYLVVDKSGARRWVLRTVVQGKRREIGLGGCSVVSLAHAREEAARLRAIARKNGDPLEALSRERRITPTFENVAREFHLHHVRGLTNEKHKQDWISSIERYAFPVMKDLQVDRIDTKEVLEVLTPIWTEKIDTARRVKQRLKTIFDYTKAKGWRSGDNPVEGIEKVLPRIGAKVKRHYAFMPYVEIPEFIENMRETNAMEATKLGLEFIVLTAARTSEVLLAEWSEIDFKARTWTVPAERMKMRREHRVPLSDRCLEILRAAEGLRLGKYVFPSSDPDRPLSNMVFLQLLERMDRRDIVVHGFRTSFRTWAEERTNTQRSVVEAALAHVVGDKVEAAYLRTDLFEKRRRLMESWAAYVTTAPKQKVVSISREA